MDRILDVENKKAADKLFELANFMGNKDALAEQLSEVRRLSHRTVQQAFFAVLKSVIEDFAAVDAGCTDLRNEAAHKWAKEVAKVGKDIYFPCI